MSPTSKKFIALFLVFSLLEISCASIIFPTTEIRFPEKKGGAIVLTKKDGQQIEGELIIVKPNSLLLLDTEGKDVSVGIADIKVIRVMKKSKVWQGVGIGFLIGASGGALLGATTEGSFDDDGRFSWILFWGIFFAAPSALIGGIIGAIAGIDKTIQIEGMTDLEIQKTLDKLRKKARIRDYK